MWFKKKEKQKLVPIRKRLQRLCKYLCMEDLNSDKISVQNKIDEYDFQGIEFFFNSNLGTVKIKLTWDCFAVPIGWDVFGLSYENYAGTTVFTIESKSPTTTEVVPMLDENFGAHEIDLAILELETYLYECYGNPNEMYNNYIAEQKAAQEYHDKQIEILEGV